MKYLIEYREGQHSFIRWIKKRIKNDLNFVALLTGETGIGKTQAAIEIARNLDPDFDSVEQIAFKFSELMRIINKFNGNGENDPRGLYKKKYKVCIFDEAQTSVNKRTWQAKANKFLLFLLSTFRHQNIIVLFTTPYEDFVDSNSLKLFHAKFECKGWNRRTKLSLLRPKILQYNAKQGKFYEHCLSVKRKMKDGRFKYRKLIRWEVKQPPASLIEPYEKSKFAFTNALNKRIYEEIMEEENPGVLSKELTEKQQEAVETIEKYDTQKEAASVLGISEGTLSERKAGAQNKGYVLRSNKK